MLLLRFARPKPVSSLAEGALVVIEGRVVPRRTLKVMSTEVAAVFHETVLEIWQSGVRGGRAMWTPTRGDNELEAFEIEDASGRVLIWPEDGKVDVRGGRQERIPVKNGGRAVSRYIAPGDVVRVRGMVRVPPKPKKGKARAALEIGAPADGKLVILFRKSGEKDNPSPRSA